MSTSTSAFDIRRAATADRSAVLRLLAAALGWEVDERHEQLFQWKHEDNYFGSSPAWVAVADDRIVGFRTFLRWEFECRDGITLALRAVDTATAPDFEGRGVFRALTTKALAEVSGSADFIFNTPNDSSLPGYLTMGWRELGRVNFGIRVRSLAGVTRLVRARQPASRWSEPSSVGVPAGDALADSDGLAALLRSRPLTSTLRTRLTPEMLQWRYANRLLRYRVVLGRDGIAGGLAILRVRHRGRARETALVDVIAPRDDPRVIRQLVRDTLRAVDTDYVLTARHLGGLGRGFFPLFGPRLTWYGLRSDRPPLDWQLHLGDVELF